MDMPFNHHDPRTSRTSRTLFPHNLHTAYEETTRGPTQQAILTRGARRSHLGPAPTPRRGRRRGRPDGGLPKRRPAPGAAERKIEPKLRAQLDGSDKAVFWVYLDSAADLGAAAKQQTRAAKAETVLRTKKEHAARSQAEVVKALEGAKAEYTSYWIVNAVRVVGSEKLAGTLAQRPEVSRIDADDKVDLPKPAEGKREQAAADAVEWNIDRIKAPRSGNRPECAARASSSPT